MTNDYYYFHGQGAMSKPPKPPRKPLSKGDDEEDIPHRTVKLLLKEDSLLSEDSLFRSLSKFGTIMDISLKAKGCTEDTILFSSSNEAKKCAASFHETVLGASAQAKYLPDLEKEEQLAVQNISAVVGPNQTELLDLEDISNFDRTAMSATINESVDSIDKTTSNEAPTSVDKIEEEFTTSVNKDAYGSASADSSLEVPKPSSSPSGGWKVAEKVASPPQKPLRQMKGEPSNKSSTASPTASGSSAAYISSDNTNEISDHFDATADASVSKYNDYLGDSVESFGKETTFTKSETSPKRGSCRTKSTRKPRPSIN